MDQIRRRHPAVNRALLPLQCSRQRVINAANFWFTTLAPTIGATEPCATGGCSCPGPVQELTDAATARAAPPHYPLDCTHFRYHVEVNGPRTAVSSGHFETAGPRELLGCGPAVLSNSNLRSETGCVPMLAALCYREARDISHGGGESAG